MSLPAKKEAANTFTVYDVLVKKDARTHTLRDEYDGLHDFTFVSATEGVEIPESIVLKNNLISNPGFTVKDARGMVMKVSTALSRQHALQADQRIVYLTDCEYQSLRRFAQEEKAPPQVVNGKKEEIIRWLIAQNNERIEVEERIRDMGENRTLSDLKEEVSGIRLEGEVIELG